MLIHILRDHREEIILMKKSFTDVGIKVIYQEYRHSVYTQYKQNDFVAYMSVMDMLFNVGVELARELIVNE